MNEKAELLFTQIFLRTVNRFNDITTFREGTRQGMIATMEKMYDQAYTLANSLAVGSKYDKLFNDKEGLFKLLGGAAGLTEKMLKSKFNSYTASIDASSIILAHSILDSTAFDYFRVIQLVAPLEDWEVFIQKKTITLEELKCSDYPSLFKQKINRYLVDLERKSLMAKIDQLFKMCKPPEKYSSIRNYEFDQTKIEKVDKLRQKIIHGEGLSAPLSDCDQKIEYLLNTTNYLMGLVYYRYNVKLNPTIYKEDLQQSSKNT